MFSRIQYMTRSIITVLFLTVLSACVSTYMKQYIGKNVEELVLTEGPAINVFDLSDGRRAFQYRIGGGTYTIPGSASTTATSYAIGSSVYTTVNTISSPASTISTPGCIVSYIAAWDGSAWIVRDIRYPDRLVC